MSSSIDFQNVFSKEELTKIYYDNIILSNTAGIDCLDHNLFLPLLVSQIENIHRKIENDTYEFTKYKLILISKGRGKIPREISIPTIRDRITIRALCDFLSLQYKGVMNFDLPRNMIKIIKENLASNKFDCFIKLDVQNFYPTMSNHRQSRWY